MKKNIFLLIVGLVIGFYIYPNLHSDVPKNIRTEETIQSLPEQNPIRPQLHDAAIKSSQREATSIATSHLPPEAPKEVISDQKKPAVVKMKLDKFLNIHLEEPIIDQLEQDKESLKQSVYTERGVTGWKIHISTGSHFLITGFQDGDVIAHESLENQLSDPERSDLAKRFVGLLSYLQR